MHPNVTLPRKFVPRRLLAFAFTLSLAALCGAQTTAEPAAAAPKNPEGKDDTLRLSPFVVNTTKDTGYYAPNTLAGSRMNTNLADLGASISVVTKLQMEDFGSLNMNDVFRYEVNTEGAGTYTPGTATARLDGIIDVNAGGSGGGSQISYTSSTANRVRGLGVPSIAINYFPANGAIPADAYNTDSFEISRGPNSMLFGVGSPAGVVNQSTAQANLQRNAYRVKVSFDDRGSFRQSFSFNRVLLPEKLALYGAILNDDQRFERKPSYDNTDRLYAALTYKPFAKTTLRANFEGYRNSNSRPNTITPVDLVTQWNLAGRPVYDALTKQITQLASGKVSGPYILSASSPYAQQVRDYIRALPTYNPALRGTSATSFNGTDTNFSFYNGIGIFGTTALAPALSQAQPLLTSSALYVPGLTGSNGSRAVMQISDGRVVNWYQPLYGQSYLTSWGTPGHPEVNPARYPTTTADVAAIYANPTWADIYGRDSYTSAGWTNNTFVSNLGNYRYPGVSDRAVYDWKNININSTNYASMRNKNYQLDLEQQITPELYFQAGWFRQDFHQSTNYTLSQLNATTLKVDVNKYLPNGTPNPYYGLPFVSETDPDQFEYAQLEDHYRAMLAYTPDFTGRKDWLKWLGRHQIIGLWSRDESIGSIKRNRLTYVGAGSDAAKFRYVTNSNPLADGTPSGWSLQTNSSTQRNFYLAKPGDPLGVATQAAGYWQPENYTGNIQVYNYATSSFENANVSERYNTFDSPSRTQKLLNSWSGGLTSYLWQERLVTTFGARIDKFKARNTTTGAITQLDGTILPTLTPAQKFSTDGTFNLNSIWNRFNPWSYLTGRTKTGGGVLRPFRNWAKIDARAEAGSQFWQFVRDFGISYNWSDNFDVPTGAQVDAFGKPLPKPSGIGHDFGFQFSLLDSKLFARVTWYGANNLDARGASATGLSRLTSNVDTTLFRKWARTIAEINLGMDPRLSSFDTGLSAAQELQVQQDAGKIWGLDYNYYTNLPGTLTATGDTASKGMEIQVNYNSGNWRNRLTFGSQTTINSNVLKQFDPWNNLRLPVMKAAKASDYLLPQYQSLANYTTSSGSAVDLSTFWGGTNYAGTTVSPSDANGNFNAQAYYDINVTPFVLISRDLNGQAAPDQRKYHAAYNVGYDFPESGRLKGFGVGGAERWESKSVIGYYGKASGSSTANPKLLDLSDTTRPIYDSPNAYTDLFIRYRRKVAHGRAGLTVQLNVENVFEDGHLQVVAVNYDASPYGYRIIDSRKFTLTTTVDF